MSSIRRQLATFALVLLVLYAAGFAAGQVIEHGDGGSQQEMQHDSGH